MSYAERMQAITDNDRRRRYARLVAEQESLVETDYHHSRGLTGEPSEKNRTYRASDDCWTRGMRGRTFGIAHRGAAGHTVKVTKNGVTSVESAHGFGRTEKAVKREESVKRHVTARKQFAQEWAARNPAGGE